MKGCTYWSGIILAGLFSVIFSCARQAAPTGGKKDITPPRLIRSLPAYGSLNYKGKKIVITFDEFIVLDKLTEKFMISPPVKKKPNITLKGKNLNIEFLEKLKDSTTYTLYFQDAIRDLNEGNPIANYQFVFSTGNILDSLSVTGNVYNSADLEVPQNTIILMHRQLADTAPAKLLPEYITLADINGGFRINNVKGGTYRLYALQDKNNDKKYDMADEGFAFLDTPAVIDPTRNYMPVIKAKDTTKIKPGVKITPVIPIIEGEYQLFLFSAAKKSHYLTSSGRKSAYHLNYTLSLPPGSEKVEFNIPDAPTKSYFIEKNLTGDSIDVWLTDSLLYSRQLIKTLISYPFTDSTGLIKTKTDSIPMRFTFPRISRARDTKSKLAVSSSIQAGSLKPGQGIKFLSETPFRKPDTTKIRLYETEKTSRKLVPYQFNNDSLSSREYLMKAKLTEGSSYLLIANAGSFSDIYGDASDSTGMKFLVRTPDSFCDLILTISNVSGNTIIQLLDEKEKLLMEKHVSKSGKLEFPLLEKGKYRLRAINDLNGDGKWTTGDYQLKQQPEPVTYYPGQLEFKQANFTIEQDWDLNKWNQKDQKLRAKAEQNR
jgi:uncharacterized protein (DUF2141 family)